MQQYNDRGAGSASSSAIARVRPFFSKACISVLATQDGSEYRNVSTLVVFGTDGMADAPLSTLTTESRDFTYHAYRWVLSADEADAFIAAARHGAAQIACDATNIRYALDFDYDGFIPRGGLAPGSHEVMPGIISSWRHRYAPAKQLLGTMEVNEANLADVAGALPSFDQIDFMVLNLQQATDRIGCLDAVYPSRVSLEVRKCDEGISYTLNDPLQWLTQLGEPTLSIEGYQFGALTQSLSTHIKPSGVLPVHGAHIRYTLTAENVILDAWGGTFVRQILINAGISESDFIIDLDGTQLAVPVVPRYSHTTVSGETETFFSVFERQRIAALWRQHKLCHERAEEVFFDGSNNANGRKNGISVLANLVRVSVTAQAAPVIVKAVDKYAFDADALKALAPIAAGISQGEVWLLTNNAPAPGSGLTQTDVETNFRAGAARIAKQLRITIKWFNPSLPLHDRFLQIDGRIWHIGHSFNKFGCDLSAIVEFRDLGVLAEIRNVFDAQFIAANLREAFW